MTKDYNRYSPAILEGYRQQDEQTLTKMYPDKDWRSCYILYLQFDLYWPYAYESIQAEIEIVTGKVFREPTGDALFNNLRGSYDVPAYKIRRPYPNKHLHSASMKNGRMVSDLGIPVLFATFEELREVCAVTCRWQVVCDDLNYDCHIMRHIDIAESANEKRRIYGVRSKERLLSDVVYAESSPEYMRNFIRCYEAIGTVRINPDFGNEVSVMLCSNTGKCIGLGSDINCKQVRPDVYAVYWESAIPNICVTRPGKSYVHDIYHTYEILEASDCSHMILHI